MAIKAASCKSTVEIKIFFVIPSKIVSIFKLPCFLKDKMLGIRWDLVFPWQAQQVPVIR